MIFDVFHSIMNTIHATNRINQFELEAVITSQKPQALSNVSKLSSDINHSDIPGYIE
jgi:hypothetical protein